MPENGQPGSTLSSRLRRGSPSFVYNQVALNATTATRIAPSRDSRAGVLFVNLSAIDIWIGDSSVTALTGTLLVGTKGASISVPTTAEVWAISASATPSISYMELYD